MRICDIFGYNPKYQGPLLGVEVEVEGISLPSEDYIQEIYKGWQKVVDNSLRGESGEFIFKNPCSLAITKKRIFELQQAFVDNKTKTDFSNRTSVHVHLNVSDLEIQQVANIIYLYYLFEDVLLKYCGEDRHDNRFCLSVRRAEGIIRDIVRRMNARNIHAFTEESHKYSALNLAAIFKKGSLEFRSMRGTIDEHVLFPWFDVIVNIYNLASQFKNPKEIQNKIMYAGLFNEMCKEIFKEHLDLFSVGDVEMEVMYNLSICAELPVALTYDKEEAVRNPAPKIKVNPAAPPRLQLDLNAPIQPVGQAIRHEIILDELLNGA